MKHKIRLWISQKGNHSCSALHITQTATDGHARPNAAVTLYPTVITGMFWAARASPSLYMQHHSTLRTGANRSGNTRFVTLFDCGEWDVKITMDTQCKVRDSWIT